MTETQWLEWTVPQQMLDRVRGIASSRKMRLFACACCRHIWSYLPDDRLREAVEVAERFADKLATSDELTTARNNAVAANDDYPVRIAAADNFAAYGGDEAVAAEDEYCSYPMENQAIYAVLWAVSEATPENAADHAANEQGYQRVEVAEDSSPPFDLGHLEESLRQCNLLRDLFGPLPFRSLSCDTSWLTPAVLSLAQTIYDDQTFHHLPILADALEEAGCINADLLAHCRQQGEHTRGCWVVDLILDKK